MTFFESSPRFSLLLEHDLFRKPVPTFRDHALARMESRGALMSCAHRSASLNAQAAHGNGEALARPRAQIGVAAGGSRRHGTTKLKRMARGAWSPARQLSDAPLALIGAAHFSTSLATNRCRYSGERRSGATTVAPSSLNRSCTEGASNAETVAACSAFMMPAGVPSAGTDCSSWRPRNRSALARAWTPPLARPASARG